MRYVFADVTYLIQNVVTADGISFDDVCLSALRYYDYQNNKWENILSKDYDHTQHEIFDVWYNGRSYVISGCNNECIPPQGIRIRSSIAFGFLIDMIVCGR